MRILLVEDEKKIAGFIAKGLKEEQYAVDVASNASEALFNLSVYEYDLIITDIMMPGMNGFEFIRKFREAGKKIPVLILTAKDSVDDKIFGLDSGADDYLTKPFAFAELLARIRALQRRPSTFVEKLEVADLVLDTVSHTVSRNGKKIELTPKEYSLLEFMLRNKGRVVTRTTIIEHVWDMQFDSDTNLVDVFISYLRKKIEPRSSTPLLHSVRGVGYILEERDSF
jgi:DNA-binding response OmpR family regulator